MFKKIVLICSFLLLYSVPVMAEEAETEMKVVLDQELLMSLGSDTRNKVLGAIQKEAEEVAAKADVATVEKTMDLISGVNIDEFKGKAIAIADTINIFCEKLGVTVNDFITTPAGTFIIFGGLWKLGVFSSVWGFFKGFACVFVLLWLLYSLNTKKIVKVHTYDQEGVVIATQDKLLPKMTGVFGGNSDELTCYAVIGSVILLILLFLTVCFVI
jgi:hypothetical protein